MPRPLALLTLALARAFDVLAAHPAAALLLVGVACLVAGVAWLAGPAWALVLLGVLLLVGGVGQVRVAERPSR